MRVVTVGGIVVFALVAAFVLAHASGQRRPGQTITGNGAGRDRRPTTDARSRSGAGRGREAQPEELRRAHRVRRATCCRPATHRRDPRVRRRGAARPEPARAADLRWLGRRARSRSRSPTPTTRDTLLDARRSSASTRSITARPEVPRRVRVRRASILFNVRERRRRRHPGVPAVPRAAPTTRTRSARRCSTCSRRREKAGDGRRPTTTTDPQPKETIVAEAARTPDRRRQDLPRHDHDRPRHDRDGPRPAARAEHRQQLRRPRARRLLRRAHVPPRRARVRDPGRLPRGQRPRRSRLQVRRRAGEGRVHARRGRDGELRARTRTARSSSSASTTASASSRRATTCSATSSRASTSRRRRRSAT